MLTQKRNLCETVVEMKGIISLRNGLVALSKIKPIRSNVIRQVENLLQEMNQLKIERAKTSNYELIEPLEKKVTEEFDKTIEVFKGGTIYES